MSSTLACKPLHTVVICFFSALFLFGIFTTKQQDRLFEELSTRSTLILDKPTTINNDNIINFLFSSFSQKNEVTTSSLTNRHFPLLQSRDQTAVICITFKDDEAYLEEWIDYHYALGFSYFYIYINEDYFYFEKWIRNRPHRAEYIKFIHHPGDAQQLNIYSDCAANLMDSGIYANDHHTWVAFIDSDEYIVLKQHTHIVDMLQQYSPIGSLALNWIIMGQDDSDQYSPIPITRRNQYRQEETNLHVKTIVRISDLNLAAGIGSPHYFPLKEGMLNKDTNGNEFDGPFNVNGPIDVAAIYHYQWKSRKEYIHKRERGKSDASLSHSSTKELIEAARKGVYTETPYSVYDDTAWQFLKKNVPKYAIFEEWD